MNATVKDLGEGKRGAVSTENYWIYPCDQTPPTGCKLFLLTKGGIAVEGQWSNDGRFIAFQYLFKRDHTKEPS